MANRRITKPPGGESSDIFSTPTSTPPSTPRKVKNYMASTIFTPVAANGAEQKGNIRQRADGNSFTRLFGIGGEDGPDGASPPATPRGGKNHQKSNVIFSEQNGHGRHNGNGYAGSINGSEGSYSGSSSGSVTPNGSINGDVDRPRQDVHNGGGTPVRRIPPGGFSSKLW